MPNVRRNDLCPCLSGKKFTACRLLEIKAGPPREAENVQLSIKPIPLASSHLLCIAHPSHRSDGSSDARQPASFASPGARDAMRAYLAFHLRRNSRNRSSVSKPLSTAAIFSNTSPMPYGQSETSSGRMA
jgi:hypothetical protein